jgi:ribosome-associated protein
LGFSDDTAHMAEQIPIRPGLAIDPDDFEWRFSRAGGPGGQGVNTTDSRVQLTYAISRLPEPYRTRARQRLEDRLSDDVLTVVASERRSQFQNRAAAQERLIDLLREATAPPPPPRRATRPSRGSVERRLTDKRQRSEIKRLRRPDASD